MPSARTKSSKDTLGSLEPYCYLFLLFTDAEGFSVGIPKGPCRIGLQRCISYPKCLLRLCELLPWCFWIQRWSYNPWIWVWCLFQWHQKYKLKFVILKKWLDSWGPFAFAVEKEVLPTWEVLSVQSLPSGPRCSGGERPTCCWCPLAICTARKPEGFGILDCPSRQHLGEKENEAVLETQDLWHVTSRVLMGSYIQQAHVIFPAWFVSLSTW